MRGGAVCRALARGLALPALRVRLAQQLRSRGPALLAVECSRSSSSLISGTAFEATKLPLRRWFLAMHLLTQAKNNVSALELRRHLGVCYKTALTMSTSSWR